MKLGCFEAQLNKRSAEDSSRWRRRESSSWDEVKLGGSCWEKAEREREDWVVSCWSWCCVEAKEMVVMFGLGERGRSG